MEKGRITTDLIGAYVWYKYRGALIQRARISYEGGQYYLCQNSHSGNSCSNKYGYSYSYCIGNGTKLAGEDRGITEITLLPESYHLVDGTSDHKVDTAEVKVYKEPEGKFKLDEDLFKPDKLPNLNQFN